MESIRTRVGSFDTSESIDRERVWKEVYLYLDLNQEAYRA